MKQTKALPVPLEPQRKKRGGRRARKEKERKGTAYNILYIIYSIH